MFSTNTFTSTSFVNLSAADSDLRLFGDTTVNAGSTISGPGNVIVVQGRTLSLDDGAGIAADVVCPGILEIASGTGDGIATLNNYYPNGVGFLSIDLNGSPASGNFDQLVVGGTAALAGTLTVRYGGGGTIGDVWKVLDGSVTGSFSGFTTSGLPAGLGLLKFETSGGVYVKLVGAGTYLDWAAGEGIPLDEIAIDDDPDGDLLVNAFELFLGTDPLVPGFAYYFEPHVIDVNGTDYLSITVVLANTFVPSDLTFQVTRSTDLQSWASAGVILHSSVFDPVESTEVRVYRSTFPFDSLEQEFLRAEVSP